MTIRLHIVDRHGDEHMEHVEPTGSLMEALRDLDYGVAAICGGMCSCATCHVYVAQEWLDTLPKQCSDEIELLAELTHRDTRSRLACQVRLSQEHDGLRVQVAPEE